MTSAEGFGILLQTTLATSAAAALVLCLRTWLMAKFGASVAYAAWGLVPVAWIAVLLPAPELPAAVDFIGLIGTVATVSASAQEADTPIDWKPMLLAAWAFGSLAMLAWLYLQQRRFDRQLADSELRADGLCVARITAGLPAVVGLLRPRIVLPADFDTRYDVAEQEMILCHERIHIARRDLHANAFAAVLRALQWFNPLLHYAFVRFRRDQELACDERVIARHPQQCRSYANAMLKTHMADSPLPVGCHWQGSHPLKERIEMLKEHTKKPMRPFIGATLVAMLFAAGGYAAWAAQPGAPASASVGKGRYAVNLNIEVDGRPAGNFKVIAIAGRPFGFTAKGDGADGLGYEGLFVASRLNDNAVKLEGTLTKIGDKPSNIGIAVKLGQSGSIAVGDRAAPDFKLEALVDVPSPAELETIRQQETQRQQPLDCLLTADEKVPNGGRYYCGKPEQASTEPAKGIILNPGHEAARGELVAIKRVPLQYPPEAARQGITGTVNVLVDVDAVGNVTGARAAKVEPATATALVDASVDGVKQWKFRPVTENGKPVAAHGNVIIEWTLQTL